MDNRTFMSRINLVALWVLNGDFAKLCVHINKTNLLESAPIHNLQLSQLASFTHIITKGTHGAVFEYAFTKEAAIYKMACVPKIMTH